ncbi:uncharacterized protein LOC117102542 [Anneissia japonica]|uniref:uncharacterized protein LOC117102542 n=1 Tax=Anneissia japonica TaxID=1529436 RepID=UPI001425943E|nr:uncharacterized protein LOC117102542 [Anneissia japonica]
MGCSLSNGLMNGKQCALKTQTCLCIEHLSRPSVVCNSTDSRIHQKDEITELTIRKGIRTAKGIHSSSFDSSGGLINAVNSVQKLDSNAGNFKKHANKDSFKPESARPDVHSDDVNKTPEESVVNVTSSASRCKRFSRLDCDWNRTRPNRDKTAVGSQSHPTITWPTFGCVQSSTFDEEFLSIEIKDIDSVLSSAAESQGDTTQITSDSENLKRNGNIKARDDDTALSIRLVQGQNEDEFGDNKVVSESGIHTQSSAVTTSHVHSIKLNKTASQFYTDLNPSNFNLSSSPEKTNPVIYKLETKISSPSKEMDEGIYTQTSGSPKCCNSKHEGETSAKNEQNLKDTQTVILKETLQTDVEVTSLNEKSCQMERQGTGSSGSVQFNMDSAHRVAGLDLVNFRRHNKLEQCSSTVEKIPDDAIDCDQQTQIQESPEVCKPLENMIIHQHLDSNADKPTISTEKKDTSSENGCHAEVMKPAIESNKETLIIDENICDAVTEKSKDLISQPANMINCHRLMPSRKTSTAEDSESDGDSAYSYESDYFPLDAVDPHPGKSIPEEVSLQVQNESLSRSGDGIALDEGCLVTSWAADDYKLERKSNRSVRGSTSNVGFQMRRGDSTNSLSSRRSQEIKWPIQHVHIDFFNDFGDCFDEEEDYMTS